MRNWGKLPPVHPIKDLLPQRQWYLYDMIRPHIPTEADKESTAPKPNVAKLKSKKNGNLMHKKGMKKPFTRR